MQEHYVRDVKLTIYSYASREVFAPHSGDSMTTHDNEVSLILNNISRHLLISRRRSRALVYAYDQTKLKPTMSAHIDHFLIILVMSQYHSPLWIMRVEKFFCKV